MNESILYDIIDFQSSMDKPNSLKKRIEVFQTALMAEYALGALGYKESDEVYSFIRQCYYEGNITTSELKEVLLQDEEIGRIVQSFPSIDDDSDLYKNKDWDLQNDHAIETKSKWERFLKESLWICGEDYNAFMFYGDGKEYRMKKLFLNLEYGDAQFYSQVFFKSNDGIVFRNISGGGFGEYPLTNIFAFGSSTDDSRNAHKSEYPFRISEDEFFSIPEISSSDDEQKLAIKSDPGRHLVILAGAGSGKTRTLVNRLAYLHLVKGVELSKILLLTFTKNAAEEMKNRGEALIGNLYQKYSISHKPNINARTIDSFFYNILLDNWFELGFSNRPILYLDNNEDTKRRKRELLVETILENNLQGLFSWFLDEGNGGYYQNPGRIDYLIKELEGYAQGLTVNRAGIENLLNLFVNKQLSEGVVLGFVYIAIIIRDALADESLGLKSLIQSRYSFFLMDEFQDISVLQYSIFSKFLNGSIHFSFVGDDDQSIYGWRGSDNAFIKELSKSPSVKTIYLLTNYRNNPNIVEAGNCILSTIVDRAKTSQKIRPNKKFGPKIRVAEYDVNFTNLVNEVDRVLKSGIAPEKVSILTRDGSTKKRINSALLAANIPVAKTVLRIENSDNYKLLKSIISVWANCNIIQSCREIKRILNLDKHSERSIQKILTGNSGDYSDYGEGTGILGEFAGVLLYNVPRDLAELVYLISLKAGEIFENNINERHSDEVFERFEIFCRNNNAPWMISETQLRHLFRTFEDSVHKELREGANLSRGVRLNTIHAAKGLEYDVVFITGLSKGVYPNTRMIDEEYQRRMNELHRLKDSEREYRLLKDQVNQTVYNLMLKECENALFSEDEKENLAFFREELIESSMDLVVFSANGIASYLDSYKAYIAPLLSKYRYDINKQTQHVNALKAKLEILNEEIALIQQEPGEENVVISEVADNEVANEVAATEIDAQTIGEQNAGVISRITEKESLTREIEEAENELSKAKLRFDRFNRSIGTIINHYYTCMKGKGFLEDMKKAREIDKIRAELLKNKEKQENEEKRTFYVALTRAKDLLYLCKEEGTEPSMFIEIIRDDLKSTYTMLTRQEEREFNQLAADLRHELQKANYDNELIIDKTDQLVSYNTAIARQVNSKIDAFLKTNRVYQNLGDNEQLYRNRALGLLFASELTGYDFRMEISHNMQRLAEERLLSLAGKDALVFRTDDPGVLKKIIDTTRDVIAGMNLKAPSREYIREIFYDKNRKPVKIGEMKDLKKLGIIHYVTLSNRFAIPKEIKKSWKIRETRWRSLDAFLAAVIELSDIRNKLIHENEKEWPEDPIPKLFELMATVLLFR